MNNNEQTQIPYIKDFIYNITERFYNTQLEHNSLTKKIMQIRVNNLSKNFKHAILSKTRYLL